LVPGVGAEDIFFWMDIFSVPQMTPRLFPGETEARVHPLTKQYQTAALTSLPYYAFIIGRFIPLVRDDEGVQSYLRRGWCSTEGLCGLTPKITQSGDWRTGPMPSALRFQFYGDGGDNHKEPFLISLDIIKNPLDPIETDFTMEEDRIHVKPILQVFANQIEAYRLSGSHSWDHTFSVEERPQWLVDLVDAEIIFN